jgi:hypothetical protein
VSQWKIVGRIDAIASDWRLKRHISMWMRALPVMRLEKDREGSRLNILRVMSSTFRKWSTYVHRNKRLLALLLRGQLLYCKHLLVVVWTSWRLVTAASSLHSATIKGLLHRRHMRCLSHAFASWTSRLANIRLLKRVFRAAAERWDLLLTLNSEYALSHRHTLADHFYFWQRETKTNKQERLLKSIYATAVVYQSIRRRRTILLSWSRWAYCSFTARQQHQRSRLALVRSLLSSWSSLTSVTRALARRAEVRRRQKLLAGCFKHMRAAARFGKCRRGPVSRRYFDHLKWYAQTLCKAMPQQHRSDALLRLVIQRWTKQRLLSLKIALCMVAASRYALRWSFSQWISHTGNRKRAIISHRLASAHSAYSLKKRVFYALKRRLADAAREFFLLGKAMLFRSSRNLNAGFRLWKAVTARQHELSLTSANEVVAAGIALPAVSDSPAQSFQSTRALRSDKADLSHAAVETAPTAVVLPKSGIDTLISELRTATPSQTVKQTFRAIPLTASHISSSEPSGSAPQTSNAASSRQRVVKDRALPRPTSTYQRSGKVAEVTRATNGTQTLPAATSRKPPLVVEHVPQRPLRDLRAQAGVVGRSVVSSFILVDPRARAAAAAPLLSPRANSIKPAV